MFIGHFAVGFAAKNIDSKPSLGTFFLASQFIDLLWPLLLLLGLEHVEIDPGNTAFTPLDFTYYPISHGLAGVLFWAVLFGCVYYALKKNLRSAILLGTLVLSHWILDLVAHRPDLPLFPWVDMKVGLGMWNSIALTMLVEGGIFVLGVYLYMQVSKSQSRSGTIGLWSLLIFLVIIYVMNVLGPPPPSAQAIAVVGLSQWLLVAWAYWVDRNRIIT